MREYEIVDGRYRIGRRIAAGGFGAIYQATDLVMGREVALKVLHRELADDAAMVARFRREAEALARLRDPHTITMYDAGRAADGMHFIVLELLRGESLHAQFQMHGAMPWRRVALIARGVCSSLGEAHALGIIHRDLKPANIHLEASSLQQDFVKVLDFGIAKLVDADSTVPDLTLAGQMIGTFDYMPPEQLIGGACAGGSDVFALAIVMYEMIAGERPFLEATGPAGRLMAMLSTLPVPLAQRADVPPALDAIVMRALSHDLEQRPDAGELDAVLARLVEDTAPRLAAAPAPIPSDISAMIDEALDEADDEALDAADDEAVRAADDEAVHVTDDDADTWVGGVPEPTVIGLPPPRPPSELPVARSEPTAPREPQTQIARPGTTRFAVGSRTELPPAQGLWSREQRGAAASDDGQASSDPGFHAGKPADARPRPVASLSMPASQRPGSTTTADNSATRRPTPVGLAPRPTSDVPIALRPTPMLPPPSSTSSGSVSPRSSSSSASVSPPSTPGGMRSSTPGESSRHSTPASPPHASPPPSLAKSVRPTPVGLGAPGPHRTPGQRPAPVASLSMPVVHAPAVANDTSGKRRALVDQIARVNESLRGANESQRVSRADDGSSQAITAKQPARRSPNARSIVPAQLPKLPVIAFTPAPSLRPTPSEVALPPAPMFATGTSEVVPPPRKSPLRYVAWAFALFGVGFAAAVALSHL